MEAINASSGIEVLGIEYAFWSPSTSKEIIESYIARGDQIDGVIVSGLMGLGALEAFTDAGLPIPPLTSGDGWTGFLFRARELGFTDFAAIPTNNFDYAHGAVGLAFAILRGETVTKNTLIPPNPIMPAEEMLGMLTDNMPEAFWFGGLIPMADFSRFADS
jgi:ribose transport system substrate-binding protein